MQNYAYEQPDRVSAVAVALEDRFDEQPPGAGLREPVGCGLLGPRRRSPLPQQNLLHRLKLTANPLFLW